MIDPRPCLPSHALLLLVRLPPALQFSAVTTILLYLSCNPAVVHCQLVDRLRSDLRVVVQGGFGLNMLFQFQACMKPSGPPAAPSRGALSDLGQLPQVKPRRFWSNGPRRSWSKLIIPGQTLLFLAKPHRPVWISTRCDQPTVPGSGPNRRPASSS